jgi:hypothetical protein
MAQSVRRRRRRATVKLRVTGAALATAAAALAVPIGLNAGVGAGVGAGAPTSVASAPADAVVPQVYGLSLKDATARLDAAGFRVAVEGERTETAMVMKQYPGPDTRVESGSAVLLTLVTPVGERAEPTGKPVDMRGEIVLGVRIGWYPERCRTAGGDACGVIQGAYDEGREALRRDGLLTGEQVAPDTYLNKVTVDGQTSVTVLRIMRDDLAVMVAHLPEAAKSLGPAAAEEELLRIAASLSLP